MPDPNMHRDEGRNRIVDSRVYDNKAPIQQVHDHGSKAHALAALIIGSVSFGGLLLAIPLLILLMDAKVTAGAAKAEATAQTAKEHARVALDKIEQTQVQLGAKGLVQPSTH